jgi:hypothetical protein
MRIRNPGSGMEKNPDPGSGMEKFGSGIRDKHPGSATLVLSIIYTLILVFLQEGVKFSAAGDIGVGNIKLAQTANVDKVISYLSQCSVLEF